MRIPIQLPPGLYRNGTAYQSKGRYYAANLVRFYEGSIRPFGGWRTHSTSTLTGAARAIISWTDNSALTWAGIGTHSHLFMMSRTGTLFDVTPTAFAAGRADAVAGGGYGADDFGSDSYGTPRPDTSLIQDASVWSLDTWGQYLIGCMADDGKIYQWSLNTSVVAVPVANAPTARAVVVTEQRILMALGANGNPRAVAWSDQEDNTDWTASATNQAGDFNLQTNGRLMLGRRIRGGTLLWTDLDVHLATYTADQFVYGFTKLADSCGAISQNCAAVIDARTVWMGRSGFWIHDGYVDALPCDVSDAVFTNLNAQQISKVTCVVNSAFGEVVWYYPSAQATENDSYVLWNYRENHWNIGSLSRLCGVDRGSFAYPLLCDALGNVYDHEVGFDYGGAMPFLEGGPFELGNGDDVVSAQWLIPDDKTVGDVTATFIVRFEPDDTDTAFGPYTLSERTDVRFEGRQVNLRFDGAALADWRIGVPRLDVIAGGER
jgi:hypothetical protein